MVDLTRLLAIGRLDFLLRVLDLMWFFLSPAVVSVDGVDFSVVVSFWSLSQLSMLPILIAIESLFVDTRLPYCEFEGEREKNAHRYINHTHANLAFICKFVFLFLLWSNCTTGFVLFRFIYSEKKFAMGCARKKCNTHDLMCVESTCFVYSFALNNCNTLDLCIHYNVIMYQCSDRILFVFFEQQ